MLENIVQYREEINIIVTSMVDDSTDKWNGLHKAAFLNAILVIWKCIFWEIWESVGNFALTTLTKGDIVTKYNLLK